MANCEPSEVVIWSGSRNKVVPVAVNLFDEFNDFTARQRAAISIKLVSECLHGLFDRVHIHRCALVVKPCAGTRFSDTQTDAQVVKNRSRSRGRV